MPSFFFGMGSLPTTGVKREGAGVYFISFHVDEKLVKETLFFMFGFPAKSISRTIVYPKDYLAE